AYLTDMTDIIFHQKGTVDKFEGDAIIAFFGAPVPFEDHALRACLASLEMQARVAEMRPLWKKKYGHELFVRMGINTGPMVVGNMGSRNRFDYTMMGDSVNLAARLEGVNKYYGTYTMASEFTVKDLGDAIVTRELDILRVVGKSEPVTVYELVARRGELSAEKADVLERFAEGLVAYRKKNWMAAQKHFKAAMNLDPTDGPSRVYHDRCAEFRKKAPPAGWDGVYTLKGK
nr:adenylate/guanylate cyclase domain-containing protein [Spirochaetota bacterium]